MGGAILSLERDYGLQFSTHLQKRLLLQTHPPPKVNSPRACKLNLFLTVVTREHKVSHAVSLQTILYFENNWHVLGENPEARKVEREYQLVYVVEL